MGKDLQLWSHHVAVCISHHVRNEILRHWPPYTNSNHNDNGKKKSMSCSPTPEVLNPSPPPPHTTPPHPRDERTRTLTFIAQLWTAAKEVSQCWCGWSPSSNFAGAFAHDVWDVSQWRRAAGQRQPLQGFHGPQDRMLKWMTDLSETDSTLLWLLNQRWVNEKLCYFFDRNIISAWQACWCRPMVPWKASVTLTVSYFFLLHCFWFSLASSRNSCFRQNLLSVAFLLHFFIALSLSFPILPALC